MPAPLKGPLIVLSLSTLCALSILLYAADYRINFQPEYVEIPTGFQEDNGLPFGTDGDWGWLLSSETPTETPIPSPTITPTSSPTVTPTSELPIVLISEVLYNPEGADNGNSFVELVGFAGRDISGWKIIGIDGGDGSIDEQFVFPQGSIFPDDNGGLGLLVVADEADGVTNVPHYDFTDPDMDLSNGPDNIQVTDNSGRVIDALAYDSVAPGANGHFSVFAGEGIAAGSSGEGFSLVRYPALFDSNNNSYDFIVDSPNPGYAIGVWPEPTATPTPPVYPVKISEILYDANGDDEGRTFVELAGPAGSDISGWRIVGIDPEDGTETDIFTFPSGSVIPDDGNGSGLFVIADTDSEGRCFVPNADFTAPGINLGNGIYSIQVRHILGVVVDSLAYDSVSPGSNLHFLHFAGEGTTAGTSGEGFSLARYPVATSDTDNNSVDFEASMPNPGEAPGVQPTPTPGATPSPTPTLPLPAPVKISELLYDPAGYDDGRTFIELIGPAGTYMGEWYLVGVDGSNGSEVMNYRFPEGVEIPNEGNGFGTLVVADLHEGQTEVTDYDFTAEELDMPNGPDNLELRDAFGQVVDALAYDLVSPGDNAHFQYFRGEGNAVGSSGSGLSLNRLPCGYSDTGNNAVDFEPQMPNPGFAVCAHPTPTPAVTPTSTPTFTPTATPTRTATPSPTITGTPTITITPGGPATVTPTITPLAANPLDVVINEIGWMGTKASGDDEWIELLNNTDSAINLFGWTLVAADGSPNIHLSGVIEAHGHFLLECQDDATISDITADQIYHGSLANDGEQLELKDHTGRVIDASNSDGESWPAGSNDPIKFSMERLNPLAVDDDSNWIYNDGRMKNGLDATGNSINGTPRMLNSISAGSSIYSVDARDIVINEIAWMGTEASPQDEWIELFNNTGYVVNLGGWKLTQYDPPNDLTLVTLLGSVDPGGYYLIERHDNAVVDTPADLVAPFGGYGLSNSGEVLRLKDRSNALIDTANIQGVGAAANPWPAGENADKATMERMDLTSSDYDWNWGDNSANRGRGQDGEGNPIRGTAKAFNSVIQSPIVVLNEIAWMGTEADSEHEWIELLNTTDQVIDLSGWSIEGLGTNINPIVTIPAGRSIPANGFFLIAENSNVFSDIVEDYCPEGGIDLGDSGELLVLRDGASNIIDHANRVNQVLSEGWYAGEIPPVTMERAYSQAPGVSGDNWASNDGEWIKGHDADSNAIHGTPGLFNSNTTPEVQSITPDKIVPNFNWDVYVYGKNFKTDSCISLGSLKTPATDVRVDGLVLTFKTDSIDDSPGGAVLRVCASGGECSSETITLSNYNFYISDVGQEDGCGDVYFTVYNQLGAATIKYASVHIYKGGTGEISIVKPSVAESAAQWKRFRVDIGNPAIPYQQSPAHKMRAMAQDAVGHLADTGDFDYCRPAPTPTPVPPPTPTSPPYLEIQLDGSCVSWPPDRPVNTKLSWTLGINPSPSLYNVPAEPGFYACMGRSGSGPVGSGPCWFTPPGGYRLPLNYEWFELPCVSAVMPSYFDACAGVGVPDRNGTLIYDTLYLNSCSIVPSDPGGSCPDPADWFPCDVHEGCAGNPCSRSAAAYNMSVYPIEKLPTEVKIPVGIGPNHLAGGDLNNDGHIDIAVSNNEGKISILIGNGDGSFAPQKMYTAPCPLGIAPADYNKDGILDLAVADYGHNNRAVSIFLNQGGGIFPSYTSYSAGAYDPWEVTSADFNKDGNMDLAAPNTGYSDQTGTTIAILMGNGNGTFQPSVQYDADVEPIAIRTGDFNRDGNEDLAVANNKRWTGIVSVLLGRGNGIFDPQVRYGVGSLPYGLVATHLNGDEFLDLATCNVDYNGDIGYITVSVLLGRGDGTFTGEARYNLASGYPGAIAALDWNLDGKQDLAVTDLINNCVYFMLGDGNGAFFGQLSYSTGGWPASAMNADFNEDMKDDLAVVNQNDANISIILNSNIPGTPITVTPVTPINTPTPSPKPVEVTLSSNNVTIGDKFWMEASVNRQIWGARYDAYVVVITPWGVRSVDGNGKWIDGVHPILRDKEIIDPVRAGLLNISSLPDGYEGQYTFIAGIMRSSDPPSEEKAIYADKEIVEVMKEDGDRNIKSTTHYEGVRKWLARVF